MPYPCSKKFGAVYRSGKIMAYLCLSLSIFAGIAKGYCSKRISAFTSEIKSASFSNLIRIIFCIVIGFFFLLFDGGIKNIIPNAFMIWISMLSGVSMSIFMVFWLFAVRRGAYVLVDVFLTLGTLVSAILSIIVYGAEFSLFDGLGFLILFISATIMCSYSANIVKSRMTILTLIILITVAFTNGISDFAKEIFNREIGQVYSVSTFNFYSFIFSAITLLIFYLVAPKTEKSILGINSLKTKGMPYIALTAIFLFLNSFFKTVASKTLDMTILAPLSQGIALVLASIMSAIIFKEKIKLRSIIGIVLAIAGILIMSFL